ncbi:hypothetical protein FAZ95_37090 [Trinickia violacea]|uniref:Terpene synthase n=2 Tax=Trinickia violacea TaxID=2571746 RepID=A0A4P8J280_9BURK|nr:hypothetical protein FAZ95_37090 [Trinickia violacea]
MNVPDSVIGADLPAFYCPLDSAIHGNMEELERAAILWADSVGLYPNETERAWGIATHSADFSCRIAPCGRDEAVLLFIKWNLWAFALDDAHDMQGEDMSTTSRLVDLSAKVVRSLESPGCAYVNFGAQQAAFDDLIACTWSMLTPFQLRRFTEGLRDWLLGAVWQASCAERAIVPNLNEYLSIRPSINGTRFSLTFSEIANNINIDPDIHYSQPVQVITDIAGFIVSCDNDLFSYTKENNEIAANIIKIISYRNRCFPMEAMKEAVAIRDHAMILFIKLREQLGKLSNPELDRYLESLEYYISGSIRWMSMAPRYASPRNQHNLPVLDARYRIIYRDAPTTASTDPSSIPTIAYWQLVLEGFS